MYKITKEGVDFCKTGNSRNPLRLLLQKILAHPNMLLLEEEVKDWGQPLVDKALSMGYLISSSGISAKDWGKTGRQSARAVKNPSQPALDQSLVWGNLPEDMPYLVRISAITERSRYIRVQFTVLEPIQYLGERLYRDYYPRSGGMEYWARFLSAFSLDLVDWPECRNQVLGHNCVSISASRDNPVFTKRYGTHLRTESVGYWEGPGGRILWSG